MPLAGKQLENFRRRDEVKNLFRELRKDLKGEQGLPRGKRKRVRRKVERLRDDGLFLALLGAYINNPRKETVEAIRQELSSHLRFDDPEIRNAPVLEIVVTAVERCAPKAQRDPRDAGFTNRQATIAAVEEVGEDLKVHMTRELSARQDAYADADRARSDRLGELDRGIAASSPRVSASQYGTDLDPERHLDALEGVHLEAGQRLREIWETTGIEGLLALLRTPEDWLTSSETWIAMGRLLGQGGEFEPAEQAFLSAAERDDQDPVRQVVRASSWAQIRGDQARASELVAKAAAMPGGDIHPAVRIAQARELIDRPQEMLAALIEVVPANPAERAGLETLRAQGHLLLGETERAEEAIERALTADGSQLGARELQGLITLLVAQDLVFDGEEIDRVAVRDAAKQFEDLRESLRAQKRDDEGAHMGARALQAYVLLEDADQLEAVFEDVVGNELPAEVATEVARSTLSAQRPDFALRILDKQPQLPLIRMLTAVARVHQGGDFDLEEAARELEKFLEAPGYEDADRCLAAYALLTASLADERIQWRPDALEMLASDQPVPAAVLEAEHLQAIGDREGAEAALLKQGAEPAILQRLAVLAAENEEWQVALDRSEALEAKDPSPANLFNRAQILRQAGELKASEQKFMQLARDSTAESSLRGRSFGRASEVAAERNNYSGGLRISDEWIAAFPTDIQAHWFKVFTLARLARYSEALQVLQDEGLSVETLDQAHLVATVFYRAAPAVAALERISDLSDQFEREDEALEAMVLFTALRRSEKDHLSDSLVERVKYGFETFPKKFPNSRRIWTIEAPKTRAEFDAFAKDLLGERQSLKERAKGVETGTNPIAALSANIGRSVSETFLRLEVLPLGYGDPGLDELEKSDALQALGSGAVWDPASIFIVGGLGGRISATVRNALPGSVLAQATLEDCDRGSTTTAEDSGDITEVGYDPDLPGARLNNWSTADSERERRRAAGMLELAQDLQAVPNFDPESESAWDELLRDDSDIPLALLTWPATLAVAQRREAPVFSDDRFVRLAARRAGLPAFGTAALLEALCARGLITEEQLAYARQRLLGSRAWGLCPDASELARLANSGDWEPSAALWRALSDKGFWLPDVMDSWRAVVAFLHEAWLQAPQKLESWVEHCLLAATTALPHNPTIHRDALLIAALEIGVPDPRLPNEFIRSLTTALQASRVPFAVNVNMPLSSFAMLLNAIQGQPGWLRVFFTAVGRFPLDVQERIIRTFLPPRMEG